MSDDFKLRQSDSELYLPPGYHQRIVSPKRRGMRDSQGFLGKFGIALWDANTFEFISYHETDNLVTNAGKAKLIDHAWTDTPGARSIATIGVGSGTTTPTATDTALETSIATKTITDPRDDTNLTGATPYTVASVLFLSGEANGNISEGALLFDDASMCTHALIAELAITGATQANPVVITSTAHGLVDSEYVTFKNVGGMTDINGNYYYVDSTGANTFALYSDEALTTSVNGTGFGAYTSGGSWVQAVNKTSAFVATATYQFGAS